MVPVALLLGTRLPRLLAVLALRCTGAKDDPERVVRLLDRFTEVVE
jgi:hypothetical protein